MFSRKLSHKLIVFEGLCHTPARWIQTEAGLLIVPVPVAYPPRQFEEEQEQKVKLAEGSRRERVYELGKI